MNLLYKKIFYVIILLPILYFVFAVYTILFIHKNSESKKLYPIVRLVEDNKTFCSGTVINNHTILTAGHCVILDTPFGASLREDIEIRAITNLPIGIIGQAYYATTQMDTGLIKGDFHLFDSMKYISDIDNIEKQEKEGNYFISCGYPLHGNLHCSNMHYNHRQDFTIMMSGILLPGMSGGPTMLADGTVIGVNVAVEGEESVVSPIYNIDAEIKK